DAAVAADPRPALQVELLLVLDLEPEVVLGLGSRVEGAREAGEPAVEVAAQPEALCQHLLARRVEGRRVVDPPRAREAVVRHPVQHAGAGPAAARAVAARGRVREAQRPRLAEVHLLHGGGLLERDLAGTAHAGP